MSDLSTPPTLAALVAVASLGARQLARNAHLAGEIARAAGCAGARVAWRVAKRAEIASMLDRNCRWVSHGDDGPVSVYAFGVSTGYAERGDLDFRDVGEECPIHTDAAEATWPAVRDLSRGGVHPVALDASRIVLAVETL